MADRSGQPPQADPPPPARAAAAAAAAPAAAAPVADAAALHCLRRRLYHHRTCSTILLTQHICVRLRRRRHCMRLNSRASPFLWLHRRATATASCSTNVFGVDIYARLPPVAKQCLPRLGYSGYNRR